MTLHGNFPSLTELIEAVIAEDEVAQQIMFNVYAPSIHRYVRRYLERNRCSQYDQDSYDVSIDVWCKVLDPGNLLSLRNHNAFVPWVYRIARNEAIAHLIKCTKYHLVDLALLDFSNQPFGRACSIEKMVETSDEILKMLECAKIISQKLHTVLVLKRVGFSTEEIAKCLNITETNVRTTISRGLLKIRRMLQQKESGNQTMRKRSSGK